MSQCIRFELVETSCPCLLKLRRLGATNNCNTLVLNLENATVREICDNTGTVVGFHIQSPGGGAKVDINSSFTIEDVEAAICECSQAGGIGSVEATPWAIQFTDETARTIADLPVTSPVESIKFKVYTSNLTINTGTGGTITLEPGDSFSWGKNNNVNISDFTFQGVSIMASAVKYTVYGEK